MAVAQPVGFVFVYRDFLLPLSETFILSQASAMRTYEPVFIGRCRVEGLSLEPHRAEVVSDGSRVGHLRATKYRAGVVPREFLARLRSYDATLIHAHFGIDALNAVPLATALGLPLVATFHGYDVTQSTKLSEGFLQHRYGRRRMQLATRARKVLAVSDFIRHRLLSIGMPESLVTTHRIGVDTTKFSTSPGSGRGPVVLAVGRFVEKKGFSYLIDAMALTQQRHPDAELMLIGTGPLGPELRSQAEDKLRSFTMPGPMPRERIAELMKRVRVMAVPSVTARSGDTEGLPMTAVEAIASGLPVVATSHAGLPEAIVEGTTGLLVPERDAGRLSDRISTLLDDDRLWAQLSTGARAHAITHFDLARQTAALERIYASIDPKG